MLTRVQLFEKIRRDRRLEPDVSQRELPERSWLLAYQERTGKPMNAILTEAVQALRASEEGTAGET